MDVDRLVRENALLRARIARLERAVASTSELIERVEHLGLWDYAPYELVPDDTWVAVDRDEAAALMSALARVDHWNPWERAIEPRPQP
ncbi:MAG: hypothetical protein ICV72_03305 [Aldersonia sp.]|nr:hypothetical protein [Aldersonia sp.]